MKTTRIVAGGMLLALALVGCSGGDRATETAGGAPYSETESGDYDAAGDSEVEGADASSADMGAPMENAGGSENREVIVTVDASLRVDDPEASAAEVVTLTQDADGRIDSRSVSAATEGEYQRGARASLTARVPAADLEEFLESLEEVGNVVNLEQSADDVTGMARDLDSRIEALEASTERLLEIIADADDSADLIAAEEALSYRQADLESLKSERAYLSEQVAMSTVNITLSEDATPTVESEGFFAGLKAGWNSVLTVASGALVLVGWLLPWIPVIGLPLIAIVWIVRRRRKNRPQVTAAESSQTPEQPEAADAAEMH